MKKFLLALAFMFPAFCIPLSASDFGALISSETHLRGSNFDSLKLRQRENARLWFSLPFTNDESVYLTGEGMYMFEYDAAGIGAVNILDLTLFKFRIDKKNDAGGVFSLHAGRFAMSDATGLIFNQTCDGLFMQAGGILCTVGLYAGYTGLLNAHDVSILVPYGTSYTADFTKLYPEAPRYVPLGAAVNFPALFTNQKLVLQGWAFLDAMKEKYNRFYGETELTGPIGSSVSYRISSALGTNDFKELMNLSQVHVIFSPINQIAIDAGFVYASGTQWIFKPFTGFTSQTATLALDQPEYTGLMKFTVDSIVTFTKDVQSSLGAGYIFDFSGASAEIDGMQLNADVIFNLFTNIQADSSAFIYMAKDAVTRNKVGGTIKISVSF